MRPEHQQLLRQIQELNEPASISDLRAAHPVNDRTLRRWLQQLADQQRIEITGTNKGRRYRLTDPPKNRSLPTAPSREQLKQRILAEIKRDRVAGRTLKILIRERVRAAVPMARRQALIDDILQTCRALS